jgi:Zn-finger nucleic acid-binding protein
MKKRERERLTEIDNMPKTHGLWPDKLKIIKSISKDKFQNINIYFMQKCKTVNLIVLSYSTLNFIRKY